MAEDGNATQPYFVADSGFAEVLGKRNFVNVVLFRYVIFGCLTVRYQADLASLLSIRRFHRRFPERQAPCARPVAL